MKIYKNYYKKIFLIQKKNKVLYINNYFFNETILIIRKIIEQLKNIDFIKIGKKNF